jgi:hypothetical protein
VKLRRNNAFTYAVEPTEKEAKQRLKPFAKSLEILPREGRKCSRGSSSGRREEIWTIEDLRPGRQKKPQKGRPTAVGSHIEIPSAVGSGGVAQSLSLRRRSAEGELI